MGPALDVRRGAPVGLGGVDLFVADLAAFDILIGERAEEAGHDFGDVVDALIDAVGQEVVGHERRNRDEEAGSGRHEHFADRAGELGRIAYAGGAEGFERAHHARHGAGEADHRGADPDHGEVGGTALEFALDADDLGEDGFFGHGLAIRCEGDACAHDVGDGGAGGLGEGVGADVVALLEELAELGDMLGGVHLAGAGLDEAVDHEPHHGHGADGDRVHDPAAFDEEVGEGLVMDPGGFGFLGRGGEGQQAQEGGAEENGTEVHLHDDGVVWVDR